MSAGAVKEYKFGQKNNWRRRTWNFIKRHYQGGPILVMPGASCYDIDVATSKGFDVRDMVAAETDPSAARAIRRRGVTVIEDDVALVSVAWGEEWGAVNVDLCGGFNKTAFDFAFIAFSCHVRLNAPISLNMLRGRDKLSSSMFEVFEQFTDFPKSLAGNKSRAERLSFFMKAMISDNHYRGPLSFDDAKHIIELYEASKTVDSYKSGHLVYDSIRFRSVASLRKCVIPTHHDLHALRRSCAAIRAHRTRRRTQ